MQKHTKRWIASVRRLFQSRRDFNRQHRLTKAVLEALESRTLLSTWTVDSSVDSSASGMGSAGPLRWVIGQAEAAAISSGTNQTVTFGSAVTSITLSSGALVLDDTSTTGLLTIQGPVTINAGGHSAVFVVDSDSTAEINNLDIAGGLSVDGGGIDNMGTLTVSNSTISGNTATSTTYSYGLGGGIWNVGTVYVNDTTISGNTATGDSFNSGGGIWNGGTLNVLNNSVISGNSATYAGGGLYNGPHYTTTISDSTITGNSAVRGGGAFNAGIMLLVRSTITENTASYLGAGIGYGSGGGIDSAGTLTVNDSQISNNISGDGGGIKMGGSATITDSILSGNTATYGAGGGINNDYGMLTVTDSTISGNQAPSGGGILSDGTTELTDSTLSGNTAKYGGGGVYGCNNGFKLTVTDSTISGNSAANGGGIYNCAANSVGPYPGYVYCTDCTIAGNSATQNGGGMLCLDPRNSALARRLAVV